MRTKTIVLLAAVGVAGAVTASAQVYSVNAVGYVNVVLCPGWNLIANPLDNKNTGDNTIQNLLATCPDETAVYKFNCGTGYEDMNDIFSGEWTYPDQTLKPGQGFWLKLPGTANVTVTFVGDVPQGHLCTPLCAGFNLVSSQVPQAGKLQTDLGYPPADGDVIYKWIPCGPNTYDIYTYDAGYWFKGEDELEPSMAVAEGFWVKKVAAIDWCRDFSVNN